MKKRIAALALALLLCLVLAMPCFAEGEVYDLETGELISGEGSQTPDAPGGNAPVTYQVELPDWYPEDVTTFEDFHDPDAPRVVDNASLFTASEIHHFGRVIKQMTEKYGCDFIIYTDVTSYGFSRGLWAADYYQYHGYGIGNDYNGLILFICMEQGNRGWWTAARGNCRALITEDNINAIDDNLEPYMRSGQYAEGVDGYLGDLDYLFEHGRMPRTAGEKGMLVLIPIIIGLVAGLITMLSMRGKMRTVAEATEADSYLQRDSFYLNNRQDFYLRSTVTRTLIVRNDDRDGGGGGSSFSGSYSSSSGASFSGGGRSF